jgi:ATP-dependent helicase HepA
LSAGNADWIAGRQAALRDVYARMEAANRKTVEERARTVRSESLGRMRGVLGAELERLRYLASVNDAVRADEISLIEREMEELEAYINDARIRLDACRLIWRGNSEHGVPRV